MLDIHIEQNQIIGAGYDTKLYMIDPRVGMVSGMKIHKRPILCLSVDQKYIVTGSEDKTVSVFDRTAGKVLKTIVVLMHIKFKSCLGNIKRQDC